MTARNGSLRIIFLVLLGVAILILIIVAIFALRGKLAAPKKPSPVPAPQSVSKQQKPTPSVSSAAQFATKSAVDAQHFANPGGKGPNCVPTPQQPLCLPN